MTNCGDEVVSRVSRMFCLMLNSVVKSLSEFVVGFIVIIAFFAFFVLFITRHPIVHGASRFMTFSSTLKISSASLRPQVGPMVQVKPKSP